MKRLVLVGGGHAHVHVLRSWIEAPLADVELVLVSPTSKAPYSGMVPGWLAGRYAFDEIAIDVAALAHRATARFIEDEVEALELDRGCLRLRRGGPLRFDHLSLNIGSTLRPPPRLGGLVLPLRPLGALRERWDALLASLPKAGTTVSRPVITAGGGAAGFEAMLAALARLRTHRPGVAFEGTLVTQDDDILPSLSAAARQRAHAALRRVGVQVRTQVDAATLAPTDDTIVLWATGAQAHPWPSDAGLAVDAAGFVRVDATLRSISHPQVHVTGDAAAWSTPLPKSGVMAVRQGPTLAANLRAALGAGVAGAWQPQRRQLALLATADDSAIASYGPLAASGRWVWHWKDRIDRQFVRRFSR